MLNYQKMIIEKVSTDRSLFEKEVRKTMLLLSREDFFEFRRWVFSHFSSQYFDILRRCFTTSRIAA